VQTTPRDRVLAHLVITRPDHLLKNVFVFPGIVIPLALEGAKPTPGLALHILIGLFAICLVASSNYVLNEILDAPSDRFHPVKRNRPVPSGKVNIALAYAQWILMAAAGLAIGSLAISAVFAVTLAALWIMGVIYNTPPVRTKDIAFLDVITEAVNNPLRMLLGWYMVAGIEVIPPVSLLASYWMIGCYFMALKRFSEYRDLGEKTAAAYRHSFAVYTERWLLVSVMFYASASMLFLGAFAIRYRVEFVLAFPLIAWVMAAYLDLSFEPSSPVQNPEHLYRSKRLMIPVVLCTVVLVYLLFNDVTVFRSFFTPTLPTS
jgi:4-hydroxybenzoate polyprenyltransferase